MEQESLKEPIEIKTKLRKSDFWWKLVYWWKERLHWRLLMWLVFVLLVLIILHNAHTLPTQQIIIVTIFGSLGFIGGVFLIDALFYGLQILVIDKKNVQRMMESEARFIFKNDQLEIFSSLGESKHKYTAFHDIRVHEKLVLLNVNSQLSIAIPCRDISEDRKDELFSFLEDMRKKIKT